MKKVLIKGSHLYNQRYFKRQIFYADLTFWFCVAMVILAGAKCILAIINKYGL